MSSEEAVSQDRSRNDEQNGYPESKSDKLEEEIRLKRELYLVTENSVRIAGGRVLISFTDSNLKEKYLTKIDDLLSDLLKDEKAPEVEQNFDGFYLDKGASKNEIFSTPIYTVGANTSLGEECTSGSQEGGETPKGPPKLGPTCFNCNGDHTLANCDKPHDRMTISINKRIFAAQRSKANVRYHEDEARNERFKPGVISDRLRQAMGLRDNEAPYYIYRMRVVGYPPGWLREALIENSGLTIYDEDNTPVQPNDTQDPSRVRYDANKLIDYPGFNVPLPPGYIDRAYEFGLPPIQAIQQRCYVENFMEKPKERFYGRKRGRRGDERVDDDMDISDSEQQDSTNVNESSQDSSSPESPTLPPPGCALPPRLIGAQDDVNNDAEQDDDDEPPAKRARKSDAETTDDSVVALIIDDDDVNINNDKDDDNDVDCVVVSDDDADDNNDKSSTTKPTSSSSMTSPKVIPKRKLVRSASSSGVSSSTSLGGSMQSLVSESAFIVDQEKQETPFVVGSGVPDASEEGPASPAVEENPSSPPPSESRPDSAECRIIPDMSSPQIVATTPGTPVFNMGENRLPDRDKFSEGVAEHIPFENLPGYTGTYERMCGVLKKIRRFQNNGYK